MADQPRDYAGKRSFGQTPEPRSEVAGDVDPGTAPPGAGFVIHQHHARRLHFDLRLEMRNGSTPVLVSWAVPKNLPIEEGVRALAVHVEDHPFEYGGFSGSIPAGNYGAGEVRIFDAGSYELTERKPGKLTFRLRGRRMQGVWHLIRTGKPGEAGKDWLAILSRWEGEPPEPLPAAEAMEPGGTSPVFDDPRWAFEPRLTGTRAMVVCEYRRTRLLPGDRPPAPGMDRLHERLVARDAVLDGVVAGSEFVAVDLVYLDGRSLVAQSYESRRRLLEAAVVPGGGLGLSASVPGAGAAMLEGTLSLGLNGVIAKRMSSPYVAGPSRDWLRIGADDPGAGTDPG